MITMQFISEGYNNNKPFFTISNPKLIPRVGEIISYRMNKDSIGPDEDDDEIIDAVTIKMIDYLYTIDGSVTVTIWI